GGVEVEALMEVELDSETGLVDVEGASEPPQEEGDHPRIAVGQLHAAVGLRSLARVEGHRSQEQISVIERADHLPSPLVGGLDLGLLAALELVRGPAASALVAAQGPLAAAIRQGGLVDDDVAAPEAGARSAAPDLLGDLGEGPAL